MRKLALVLTGVSAFFVGFVLESCKAPCEVGMEACDCTTGGACNPGLTCLSGLCVNAGPNPNEQSDGETGNDSADEDPGDGDPGDGDPGDGDPGDGDPGDGDGDKLDMPEETDTDQPCSETGCKKVDLLFSLDGSLSMIEENNALKA